MKLFFSFVWRDIQIALREGGAIGTQLGFYAIAVAMIPIAVGPDLNLLARIAPGVLWIMLLLSALLSLGRMFERDLEDGSLDIYVMGVLPLALVVAAKALAHWATCALPLVILAPLLGIFLNVDPNAVPMIVATMLVGTVAVSFLGSVAAALTVRSRRGGILIALLVLPLYVPTLIYGITSVSMLTLAPGDPSSPLAMLGAISLVSIVIGPIAAAAALRYQLS